MFSVIYEFYIFLEYFCPKNISRALRLVFNNSNKQQNFNSYNTPYQVNNVFHPFSFTDYSRDNSSH